MAWFVRGMTFQRAEISRLRIGGIAYHELGELRDWWVFMGRSGIGGVFSHPIFPALGPWIKVGNPS